MSDPKWWKVYKTLDARFTPQEAVEWLETPNVLLDDKRPDECSAEAVLAALRQEAEEDR